MLVQLLLQGLLQIHPATLILLVVVPEAEVRDLEGRKVTEAGSHAQKDSNDFHRQRPGPSGSGLLPLRKGAIAEA